MSTLVYLARHGETDDNARKVFQGQRGGSLNARGRSQAEKLAARISSSVDALVSSDLARARETAEIVGAAAKLEPAWSDALREIDVGAWSGLSHDEAAERFPDEWAAWRAGIDRPRGGGETYADVAKRVMAALGRIAETHRGRRVLVVSHGAALRSAVCVALGMSPSWRSPLGGMKNAALTTLLYEDTGEWLLVTYNDAGHLGHVAM